MDYDATFVSYINMSHNDWQTPPELVRVLKQEFPFDLDAAADESNTICPTYISQEQDALRTPWTGSYVWCNMPYSLIGSFVQRAYEQSIEQQNTVVVLVPAYTDPKYWSNYVMKAHEVRFLKGRLQFLENGQKKQSARFPSVVVVFKHITGGHYGKSPNQWVWDWRG